MSFYRNIYIRGRDKESDRIPVGFICEWRLDSRLYTAIQTPSVGIRRSLSVGIDRPLKLVLGTNFSKLLINSRDRSKPIDRFRQIPTLGIPMSVHNPELSGIVVGFFDLGTKNSVVNDQ